MAERKVLGIGRAVGTRVITATNVTKAVADSMLVQPGKAIINAVRHPVATLQTGKDAITNKAQQTYRNVATRVTTSVNTAAQRLLDNAGRITTFGATGTAIAVGLGMPGAALGLATTTLATAYVKWFR